jgi:hypothetical protein
MEIGDRAIVKLNRLKIFRVGGEIEERKRLGSE